MYQSITFVDGESVAIVDQEPVEKLLIWKWRRNYWNGCFSSIAQSPEDRSNQEPERCLDNKASKRAKVGSNVSTNATGSIAMETSRS